MKHLRNTSYQLNRVADIKTGYAAYLTPGPLIPPRTRYKQVILLFRKLLAGNFSKWTSTGL
jgi:hypothetical protein